MTEIIGDIDVSGAGRQIDPAHGELIAQGVALVRAMIERMEEEHGPIGLDVLLSAYISMATASIGFAETIAVLDITRARLIEISPLPRSDA